MAHRLHVADLQIWADVQIAGAFREAVFYFHPNNCSVTAAHQDPSYLLSLVTFVFELLVVRNKPPFPIVLLPYPNNKRTTPMSQWKEMTPSHHLLYTCFERALGSLRNRPRKWECV
ncbi:hypothetical protein PAMP_008722 [Pampus punctatissimus]